MACVSVNRFPSSVAPLPDWDEEKDSRLNRSQADLDWQNGNETWAAEHTIEVSAKQVLMPSAFSSSISKATYEV